MDNNFLIAIGKRISEIRRSHNMTQEVLAEHLNVSPKHISYTERGISSLSLKNLIELCKLFDCSLDFIILGKKENSALSKLPDEIVNILYTGKDAEINCLNRYLQIYIELTRK